MVISLSAHLRDQLWYWQGYPLRPELAESTFLLHAATGNAAYLAAGRELQVRLQNSLLPGSDVASMQALQAVAECGVWQKAERGDMVG